MTNDNEQLYGTSDLPGCYCCTFNCQLSIVNCQFYEEVPSRLNCYFSFYHPFFCLLFFPADIEGRILFQHDTVAGVGAGQEAQEYLERTGERTRWTNSLFGGMPTYQMSPSYDSTKPLSG